MTKQTPKSQPVFEEKYDHPDDLWLGVFFTPSVESQKARRAFLKRIEARQKNRDSALDEKKVAPAQLAAIATWGAPKPEAYSYLKQIRQPVLVVNGDNDTAGGREVISSISRAALEQYFWLRDDADAQCMLRTFGVAVIASRLWLSALP